jgi:glyoxylase-like metal-dependent hydrolase (beta-lactamase superfamily II)
MSSPSGAHGGAYTGKVSPGGTPDTRELAGLVITKVAVDPEMSNNCYLLRCRATDQQLLIDAAAEPETLRRVVGSDGLTKIVTTHQHWDHHRALADLVEATGAVVLAGEADADAITEQTGVPVDDRLRDGDTIEWGECRLEVIHLVGHTPGSVALLYDDPEGTPHLWTGDSLFPGGVGNTFGDEAAFGTLIEDVSTKVFDRLPDETWFYPGHGDDSTLGAERPHLPEWRERGW